MYMSPKQNQNKSPPDTTINSWLNDSNMKPRLPLTVDSIEPEPESYIPSPVGSDYDDDEGALALGSILMKGNDGSANINVPRHVNPKALMSALGNEMDINYDDEDEEPEDPMDRLKRLHPQAFPNKTGIKRKSPMKMDDTVDMMPGGYEENNDDDDDDDDFHIPAMEGGMNAPANVEGLPRKFDPWAPDQQFSGGGPPGNDGFQGIYIPEGMDDEQFVHEFLERQELSTWLNEQCPKANFGNQKFTAWSNLRYMRGLRQVIMKRYGKNDMVAIGRAGIQSAATGLEQLYRSGNRFMPFNCNELSFRTAGDLEEGTYDNALGELFEEYLTGDSKMDPILKLAFLFGFTILKNHQREGLNEQEQAEKKGEMMQAMREYVAEEFGKLSNTEKRDLVKDAIQANPQEFMKSAAIHLHSQEEMNSVDQQSRNPNFTGLRPVNMNPIIQSGQFSTPSAPVSPETNKEPENALPEDSNHPEVIAEQQGYRRPYKKRRKHGVSQQQQGQYHPQAPLPGQPPLPPGPPEDYELWQQEGADDQGAGVFPPIPPEMQEVPGTPRSIDMPQSPSSESHYVRPVEDVAPSHQLPSPTPEELALQRAGV